MSNVGYATLTILPSAKGFQSALSKEVGGGIDAVGSSSGKRAGGSFVGAFKGLVGPAVAIAGSAMFAGFIRGAAQASDATDKFKATMSFAGLKTTAIDAATKATKAYADQTVYDLPTIQNTTAQLASNGIKDYMGLTKAAGNLNAVAGGSAETFKGVSMVMTQTAGAGKLTTENWNQLSDAIPGAAGPLMKAMKDAGAYTGNFRKAMENGEITADEFNAAILKLGNKPVAVEAAKSTKTFEGALGNLEATINSGLMKALDAMKPTITGAINLLSKGLGGAFDFVGRMVGGLGDRVGPVFGRIKDAVKGVFDILVNGDFKPFAGLEEDSGVVDFLFTLRDAAKSIGDTLGSFLSPVMSVLPAFLSTFSPLGLLLQSLTPVLPVLATAFAQLGATVGGVLTVALASAAPVVQSLVSALSGVFVAVMPAVVQLVGLLGNAFAILAPVIMGVITAVMPLITSLVSQLAPILSNLVTAIMPPVVSSFTMIVLAIGPLIQTLQGVLIPVIQALMPVVVTVFGVIANVVKSAMQIVQGVIQVVTGIISGNWSQVWSGIQNVFGGIWNTIGALLSGALSIIRSAISAALSIIGSLWNSAWNGISSFLGGIWNGIVSAVSGAIGRVVNFFGGLLGKITGALGNAGRALWDVGVQIIQGLIDGISSMMGAIGRAILSLVPGPIVGVFKNLLGIHSPSRVFRGFGVNIGEGLVLGIQDMHGDVEDAVGALGGVAAGATIQTPTVEGGGVSGAISSALSRGGGAAPVVGQLTLQSSGDIRDDVEEALFHIRRINRGGLYA
ncbi:tail length tape measure protein [Arthrobacter phage Liebe]|uniref:Tape measure protein n=2 Tax=Arthrobacter virus Liebe TaxID=2734245 RepID=A0A3G2KHP2_9CAUD|nr:tail length tape measure protein [Arthrobacter phage Liebe]AYN58496.1 tape measure protein [Arthrobacter phage Maureen]AZF93748.1 tape measure protein [Arthrobacter phage Liebe]